LPKSCDEFTQFSQSKIENGECQFVSILSDYEGPDFEPIQRLFLGHVSFPPGSVRDSDAYQATTTSFHVASNSQFTSYSTIGLCALAARPKTLVCDRSPAGILGSNPVGDTDVCRERCVLSRIDLRFGLITHPEESYRIWCDCEAPKREAMTRSRVEAPKEKTKIQPITRDQSTGGSRNIALLFL
jgi:hypothetical protein